MKIRSHKQFDLLYRQLSPHDKDLVRSTLEFFVEDPFHPSLRTHALRGELIGYWSLSVDRDLRVLFSEK
jgi:mRNA-degrading endonuclease YafQ of YafQ-DinJ toxin-antitoxin module